MDNQLEIIQNKPINVKVQETSKKVTYKTKIHFIDGDRGKIEIVSVVAPTVAPSGLLQFLLEDRLISYPISVVFRFETEQLVSLEQAKIII